MELVSLRCNREFISASSYGLGWYKYAIATKWYQFHTTDAWWFSLNISPDSLHRSHEISLANCNDLGERGTTQKHKKKDTMNKTHLIFNQPCTHWWPGTSKPKNICRYSLTILPVPEYSVTLDKICIKESIVTQEIFHIKYQIRHIKNWSLDQLTISATMNIFWYCCDVNTIFIFVPQCYNWKKLQYYHY